MYSTIIIKSKDASNSGSCFLNTPIINRKYIVSLWKPIQLGMICHINCKTSLLSSIQKILKEEYPDATIIIISQI